MPKVTKLVSGRWEWNWNLVSEVRIADCDVLLLSGTRLEKKGRRAGGARKFKHQGVFLALAAWLCL